MPPYSDVYVLSSVRSAKAAESFLNTFAPHREQSAKEYEFPRYAEQPQLVVKSAPEAILYCEAHPSEAQSLYFRNLREGPAHAMLFFTSDGALILGLSVVDLQDEWFGRLKKYAGSNVGLIAFEAAPPATAGEFWELASSVA